MVIESGITKQAGALAEGLTIKNSVEKTPEEAGQETKIPTQGDKVSISEEAKALAAPEKAGTAEGDKKEEDPVIRMLKQQIERVEKEIKELQENDELPEKEKNQQLQTKQAQLMELRDQLLKAQEEKLKASGAAIGGGTRAQGFGSSLT